MTLDEYFAERTHQGLDATVDFLGKNSFARFIYAEVAYLDKWWKNLIPSVRTLFTKSVFFYISKKLNACIKGEVMAAVRFFFTIQACPWWPMGNRHRWLGHAWRSPDPLWCGHIPTHRRSTLATWQHWQVITTIWGHYNPWLRLHIVLPLSSGVVPNVSWVIDVFGHSATAPYILRKAGIRNALINRVHYEVKKALAKSQNLEFIWRQSWGKKVALNSSPPSNRFVWRNGSLYASFALLRLRHSTHLWTWSQYLLSVWFYADCFKMSVGRSGNADHTIECTGSVSWIKPCCWVIWHENTQSRLIIQSNHSQYWCLVIVLCPPKVVA